MKNRKCICAIVTGVIVLCGCTRLASEEVPVLENQKHVKRTDILSLCKGITLTEVKRQLGGSGKYQFSARMNEGDFHCVSYSFGKSHVYYYFLFQSNVLLKIVEPPRKEVDLVPYKDVHLEIEKPLDAEKRIKNVLVASDLSGEQLFTSLKLRHAQKTESFNVLPAFIASGLKSAKTERSIQVDYETNELLARKFDPDKVKLGDSEGMLVLNYGNPLTLLTNVQEESRQYQFGSNEPLKINPAHRFSSVSIVIRQEVVTRIFCHDFIERK